MISNFLYGSVWRGAALGVLVVVGCGEASNNGYNAIVQGTVTIDGELAKGGTVSFFPVGEGPVAVSSIAADGSYALRIGQGNAGDPDSSKMPSGKYVAAVEVTGTPGKPTAENEGGPLPAGPRLMADKYASQETSGLEFEVTKGMNVFELKLDGPWANPPEEAEETEDAEESEEAEDEPTDDANGEGAEPESDSADPTTESAQDVGPAAESADSPVPPAAADGVSATEGQP
jgi:hypothetical protein